MDITFNEFYQKMGLEAYPFRERTSEKEDVSKLFVKPLDHAMLYDTFTSYQTAIINGDRGTGKTIMLSDFQLNVASNRVACTINNFESIPLQDNLLAFYTLILQNITQSLLIILAKNRKLLKKMSYDNKIFLSFLIMKFGDAITNEQLYSQIENIQLSFLQRLLNKFSKPITSLLNYSATTVTNFGNELLNRHFGSYLPAISESEIRKIFPDIHFTVSKDFKSVEISYSLLNKALLLIKEITGIKPFVSIDKLDEDIRLGNDAEAISSFIKDLLCNNDLLLNPNIQLFIAVWKIPFSSLSSSFRRSKHYVYDINWDAKQLENILNQRLKIYSNNRILNFRSLFENNITESTIHEIFSLANSNPRDLWGLLDEILKAQFMLNNSHSLISNTAVLEGMNSFVKNFSFYEYYPRRKTARKNTNDIYSYIKYLSSLNNTDEFTNDELRSCANTGGSTTNYITGMMNIGLVKKTDLKRAGGSVIYKIIDPKITYAIYHHIEIAHS